jgi:hypothetical protein
MGIVIGVVGHESRRSNAELLASNVGAGVINIDDGTLKCEGNHLRVLGELNRRAMAIDNCWCVVLEDDAEPVAGFPHHLQRSLRHAPSPVVGFYIGTGNPSGEAQRQIRQAVVRAEESRRAWITGDCLIGSVGYAVHDHVIDDMLAFIENRDDEELPLRISRWAQRRGHQICYTQPSLVDHRDDDPVQRCAPGRRPRKAWKYGTRENWDTGSVQLGYIPRWSGGADGSFEIGARLGHISQFRD